jgi:hypothetical protein
VKRVIANMTVGKDCSALFADVVKNMQTENREMKKLGTKKSIFEEKKRLDCLDQENQSL